MRQGTDRENKNEKQREITQHPLFFVRSGRLSSGSRDVDASETRCYSLSSDPPPRVVPLVATSFRGLAVKMLNIRRIFQRVRGVSKEGCGISIDSASGIPRRPCELGNGSLRGKTILVSAFEYGKGGRILLLVVCQISKTE